MTYRCTRCNISQLSPSCWKCNRPTNRVSGYSSYSRSDDTTSTDLFAASPFGGFGGFSSNNDDSCRRDDSGGYSSSDSSCSNSSE